MRSRRVSASEQAAATEPSPSAQVTDSDIDAVLDACRTLVAIAARSVEAVADRVDLVEIRILVMLDSRGGCSLRELADATGLHLSRASRACERLVGKHLITRSGDPSDRRMVQLCLTREGDTLVQSVVQARRTAIEPALEAMSSTRRTELIRGLRAFAKANDYSGEDTSTLAWTEP